MPTKQAFTMRAEPKRQPKPVRVRPAPQPARRKPATRPGTHPWRPTPKPQPTPAVPPDWNPRPFKPKKIPFGKRLPVPAIRPNNPAVRKAAKKLLIGLFPRLFPGLGWAMLGWDLYQLYLWMMENQAPEPINENSCRMPEYSNDDRFYWYPYCQSLTSRGFVEGHSTKPAGVVSRLQRSAAVGFLDWYEDQHYWEFDLPDGTPAFNPDLGIPVPVGIPILPLPYPYPGSVQPVPVQPPMDRPQIEPEPEPDPVTRPTRPPTTQPGGSTVPTVPSIDWTPGGTPKPDDHEVRPPDGPEREKKKRLNPAQSRLWLNMLVGSFTETDDAVKALYKGLPWKLRRWRGRDGVWRDRDHTTAGRLQTLYAHLGQLDVGAALQNLLAEHLSDKAFGMAGQALKNRAKDLGDEGLYSGAQGFGGRPDLKGGTHEEARKELIRAKYREDKARGFHHNWYRRKVRNPKTGAWETKLFQRPDTQIPWLRYKGRPYQRPLTGAQGAYSVKTDRYYYRPYNSTGAFIP